MICTEKQNFKAPNGEQSKLYSDLYDAYGHEIALKMYSHVRIPSFKSWFGDWENNPEGSSKAVDSNGEPLVLWHGTTKEFDPNLKRSSGYVGFYATPDYNFAHKYGLASAAERGLSDNDIVV